DEERRGGARDRARQQRPRIGLVQHDQVRRDASQPRGERRREVDGADRANRAHARHLHVVDCFSHRGPRGVRDEDVVLDEAMAGAAERLEHALHASRAWRIKLADVQHASHNVTVSRLDCPAGRPATARYSSYTLEVYRDQLKASARTIPASRRWRQATGSLSRSISSRTIVWAHVSRSPTAQYVTAGPPTSFSTGMSLATTGVPHASASMIGSPNPSRSDGNKARALRR